MTAQMVRHPLAGTQRLLGIPGGTLAEHSQALGPVPRLTGAQLHELVEASGLTGRGGAGFPTARKIAAVAASRRRPVVVGNAMEGEYLSHKDRVLVDQAPHLVLDGLEILGHALGARRRILATGERIDAGRARFAATERSGRPVEVRELTGGFLAGQESALVSQLNGGPGVPRDPHSPVYESGVDGRPTLVVNAETLAQLALVARFGPDWFRSQGTRSDPGTFLVTVSGSGGAHVLEVARGSVLRDVLARSGARLDRLGGVLVGGYHGTWLPPAALDVRLYETELAVYGASTGAGILHLLDADRCPLRISAEIASYLAGETAGQCGPCINGMPRMADTLTRLAVPGGDPRLLAEVKRLRGLVVGRGACAHPDGTARFVASTMHVFAHHVDAHLRGECHETATH
ncbi:MAG: NADH-ubiquinone oxidoreductase-F iron-sulfur binding region domain-containing protein [Marmoricola sp.]